MKVWSWTIIQMGVFKKNVRIGIIRDMESVKSLVKMEVFWRNDYQSIKRKQYIQSIIDVERGCFFPRGRSTSRTRKEG